MNDFCKRGHSLSGDNLYVLGNRRACRECRAIRRVLRAEAEGKYRQFDPQVSVIRMDEMFPFERHTRVSRGFFTRLMERLKMLRPNEALRVDFQAVYGYQPNTSQIARASQQAGIRVAAHWRVNKACTLSLFLRRLR